MLRVILILMMLGGMNAESSFAAATPTPAPAKNLSAPPSGGIPPSGGVPAAAKPKPSTSAAPAGGVLPSGGLPPSGGVPGSPGSGAVAGGVPPGDPADANPDAAIKSLKDESGSSKPSGRKKKDEGSDSDFRSKLSESIRKTEQSIKVIRKQIVESQNAPFLPDLYNQLGDLLSQKAITLYYIKMENDSGIDAGPSKVEEATPVVQATREAIEVYKTVIHDFPTYAKRAEVYYKLAVSYKSIDDTAQFIGVSGQILKLYPNTDYSMRTSLLLGRHFLDEHEWDEAYKLLKPIADGKLVYEKNLARDWIGLIYLGQEKYKDALASFESVVQDPELKEQENPYDLKKASGRGKTDLKREALIDSIRAYTFVFDKNPDPVTYYSKLAPTETYFQEVMEKLAIRYVVIKKFDQSVKLLRTTSERTSDPQKVINVYREVLLLMPLEQRLAIPVDEMSFVLHKFNLWQSYYTVEPKALSDAYWFFEKQIRDVGTRNHDLAKTEKDPGKKKHYFDQSRDYYHLYLPFFNKTPSTVKLATDLADVYYLTGDFLKSGDTYIRIFQGEFGKTDRPKAVIENAILSLQKDKSEDFYEKVRAKGLLLKAITVYQASNKALKNDAPLELLRLKTEYEQGFLPKAIDNLYAFAKANHGKKQAMDATDIILDHFNTLNDFQNLQFWADRVLALKFADASYNAKVAALKTQSKSRLLAEKVKSIKGYDEFSQGKSYLTAALQTSDPALAGAVIQEALAKAKREHDLKTFLEAATVLANKEKNPQKRANILRSVSQENVKIGKFYTGIAELRDAAADNSLDATTRKGLMEDSVSLATMLHDPEALKAAVRDPRFPSVSAEARTRVREQIADALDSPVSLSQEEVNIVFQTGLSEDVLLSLYKARNKLSAGTRARVDSEVKAHCGSETRSPVCVWNQLAQLEGLRARTIQTLRTVAPDLKSLEATAGAFMDLSHRYQVLEGAGDAHLETAVSIRGKELYTEFANYLTRVGNANAALKADLAAKAKDSYGSANIYDQKCKQLIEKAATVNPAMKYCAAKTYPSMDQMLTWNRALAATASRSDDNSAEVVNMQRSVFSAEKDPEPMLRLAAYELQSQRYYHAAALASYGSSIYKERDADFKSVLGCALVKLGYLTEASFHLKTASDYQNLKAGCLGQLQQMRIQ